MKDKMLKKAKKYVRSNAVYYGNNQYRLDLKDWLYFIEGCINEIKLSSIQRMADENKDTQRLDFLDNCNKALNKHSGTNYGWELILNHNVNRLMSGSLDRIDLHDSKAGVDKLDSCRDAIDKAIDRLKAQQLMEREK